MVLRVGFNGFGRIGRSLQRVVLDRRPAVEWGYANRHDHVVELLAS